VAKPTFIVTKRDIKQSLQNSITAVIKFNLMKSNPIVYWSVTEIFLRWSIKLLKLASSVKTGWPPVE